MTTVTNMYAMTWSGALAEQDGLKTIMNDAFNMYDQSRVQFNPEMVDGFLMAQAGQLAHLCTPGVLGIPLLDANAAHRDTLNYLAMSGLKLGAVDLKRDAFETEMLPIFDDLHEARTNVSPDWFKAFAKRSPSIVPMPSSAAESLTLFWSVLLEDPAAALKDNVEIPSLLRTTDGRNVRMQAGFNMALASLLTLLPYYGEAKSAGDIAKENLRLGFVGKNEILNSINRIAARLEQIPRSTRDALFVDMRLPGGLWSLWNTPDHAEARSHFRSLPHFDPSDGLRDDICGESSKIRATARAHGGRVPL